MQFMQIFQNFCCNDVVNLLALLSSYLQQSRKRASEIIQWRGFRKLFGILTIVLVNIQFQKEEMDGPESS